MKKVNCTLLVMFTLCILVFSSCKKSETPPIPEIGATSITFKFNGILYNSPSAIAIYTRSTSVFQIGATYGSNASLYIVIPHVKVGSFDLSYGNASLSFTGGPNGTDTYSSVSGTLVISELTSTTIVATFDFTGVDALNVSKDISNGQFITSYTTVD